MSELAQRRENMHAESALLALLDDIEELVDRLQLDERFNVFEAAGMRTQEIRHSRFLAHLLNPSELHGLGDRFLRSFLNQVLTDHPEPPVSRLSVAVGDLSGAFVYCERDRFDIAVEIPSLNLLVVVENKIRASQRDEQLPDYRRLAETKYQGYRFLGVFLTPDGYEGEDTTWVCLDYRWLAEALTALRSERQTAAAVASAIEHYVDLLRRRVVTSPDLINACRQIYAKHKTALNLIMQHGYVPVLAEAFRAFKEQVGDITAFVERTNDVAFTADHWRALDGFQVAQPRWGVSCPVKFWFHLGDAELSLILEVGPVLSEAKFNREHLVRDLRKRMNVKSTRAIGPTFTRICTYNRDLTDDSSAQDIMQAMVDLWARMNGSQAIVKVHDSAMDTLTHPLL